MNNDDLPTRSLGAGDPSPDGGRRPEVPDNYQLVQRLGEGGMGEVWEALQLAPVRRSVALKLIRRGLDSREVIARFEGERQALALMDHPYIARVFDAGETESGRLFFVMELVRGVPITQYCDRLKLPTRERLVLFRKVCAGVQHAHQKAIIHRDLKPSNVLVTVDGDEVIPKIIDFGVAKAVASRLTERTLFTELGQMVGTPEYMSPEQAAGGIQDIDTRSDVYSLGVLLYELLVGALPCDSRTLRAQGLEAIHQIIREIDPPKPSTRISSLGDSSTVCAEARSTDVERLRSDLAGDLDWITMKALEKDRARRYDTASALSADIERYLSDEPVLASPPSAAYRARKFLRRHRVATTAAALVLTSLLLGVVAATWGLVRAREAERQAVQDAETARQVSELMVEIFEKADPDNTRGSELTVREVLDSGMDRIEGSLDTQPRTRAALLETMGRVYTALGLYDQAKPMLEDALELRREDEQSGPIAQARAQSRLAAVTMWQGDYEGAIALARQAVALLDGAAGSDREKQLELASALNVLGNCLQNQGHLDEARAVHERALLIRQALLGEDDEAVASSTHNLAIVHHMSGELERAAELYQRSAEIERANNGDSTPGYATSLHTLAMVRQEQGRFEEATALEQQALEIRERTLGPDHPHVAYSLTTLAQLYAEAGRFEEAENLLRRARAIGETVWHPLHPEVRWIRRSLAEVLSGSGREAEARALLVELVEETEAGGPEYESALVPTLIALADLDLEAGDISQAEAGYERGLAIEERVSRKGHPYLLASLVPLVAVDQSRGVETSTRCQRARSIAAETDSKELEVTVGAQLVRRLDELCPP